MSKFPAAKHLNNEEYRLLLAVYASHNSSMGLEERKNYTLSDIVKVERSVERNCLEVHYQDGEWWHYYPNGKWD